MGNTIKGILLLILVGLLCVAMLAVLQIIIVSAEAPPIISTFPIDGSVEVVADVSVISMATTIPVVFTEFQVKDGGDGDVLGTVVGNGTELALFTPVGLLAEGLYVARVLNITLVGGVPFPDRLDCDSDGEFDDFCWTFTITEFVQTPSVIELVSFMAKADANHILLTWETGAEIDNAGFNLYRASSQGGSYTKINDALVPAEGGSTTYTYLDTKVVSGKAYFYQLEDVDTGGVSTIHQLKSSVAVYHQIFLPFITNK